MRSAVNSPQEDWQLIRNKRINFSDFVFLLLLFLFSLEGSAQGVHSEAFTVECGKHKDMVSIRIEKGPSHCKVFSNLGGKKRMVFKNDSDAQACEAEFQKAIKWLKKRGYKCE